MRWAVALLAAASLLAGSAGCGGAGAEPGAPRGAVLVLDFIPNPVHSGIYSAEQQGLYREAGVELEIQQPGESTDAPKLLAAGRAELAVLDIHDLGIARERGLDLVGLLPIVQRPLASVIARGNGPVRRPRDLEGRTVGVTGLPSDEAVVDSVLGADGANSAAAERVTIGFNAVSALAAEQVDAATGFWNAEGVALRRQGIPTRVFKVDDYGAPPYPELVLATSHETLAESPGLIEAVVEATEAGYEQVVAHPRQALGDLLAANPSLDRAEQQAQLDALLPILDPQPFDPSVLREWSSWDVEHGLLERPVDLAAAFRLDGAG